MQITTILFDLDGTLLPMDQDVFTSGYFKLLAQKMAPRGYDPKNLVASVWAGTLAMVKNDGKNTNEDAFWARFARDFGDRVYTDKPLFNEFYEVEFQQAKAFCGCNPAAADTVRHLKAAGYRLALATNPLFPAVATHSRVRWAGLDLSDFSLCTTYENSHYCKPNPLYYQETVNALGVHPEECLMVGNDVTEDMVAGTLGMQVFLLTDCLINKENKDISQYPHGTFSDLQAFLSA